MIILIIEHIDSYFVNISLIKLKINKNLKANQIKQLLGWNKKLMIKEC